MVLVIIFHLFFLFFQNLFLTFLTVMRKGMLWGYEACGSFFPSRYKLMQIKVSITKRQFRWGMWGLFPYVNKPLITILSLNCHLQNSVLLLYKFLQIRLQVGCQCCYSKTIKSPLDLSSEFSVCSQRSALMITGLSDKPSKWAFHSVAVIDRCALKSNLQILLCLL